MAKILEVTDTDIHRLDAKQLTDLLRRLLLLEADRYSIPRQAVDVSLQINVPDGGSDGQIEWTDGLSETDFIPSRHTLFQCKATKIEPAGCKKEIQIKGSCDLKPEVEHVLDNGGAYVLFCTQSLNTQQKNKRIEKIREAIKEAGKRYDADVRIEIYDAGRIQNWVNLYPAAIAAILEWAGRATSSPAQTWDHWSRYGAFRKFSFVADDQSTDYIRQLREHLSSPRSVARIVGLSGLGKTRLALETFRPQETKSFDESVLVQKVVYMDASHDSQIADSIYNWTVQKIDGIVVVDNCDLALHKTLQGHVEHEDSRLSLLTLDYDTHPLPNIHLITLDRAPDSVIKKMLAQHFSGLPDTDLARITEFAQGFPQMAVLLAEARLQKEPDLSKLTDDDLLQKLLWGRRQESEKALQVITACSLFEHLGLTDDREDQYKLVAKEICDLDPSAFYAHVKDFVSHGIVDERGRYISVVPVPLAVRLAADWWRRCSPERAHKLISMEMPDVMAEALCQRMAKLDFLPEAQNFVRDLCGDQRPFGQAEVLRSKRGSQLFRFLAEVNPVAAARAVENAFCDWSREQLLEVVEGRRDLIWALEKLCFRKETFPKAVRVLLRFAAAENESWSNNATGIFRQLFHVYLSGTEAPPADRLQVIDEALQSEERQGRELAVYALGEALQTSRFTRSSGAERQGSSPDLKDWHPTQWKEIFDYWKAALDRLASLICDPTNDCSDLAKEQMSRSIRGLVENGRIEDVSTVLRQVVAARGPYWPAALDQLRDCRRYESKLSDSARDELQELIALLQPDKLSDRLRLLVSQPSWDDWSEGPDGSHIDQGDVKATSLADELAANPLELTPCLPALLKGEQRKAFVFGKRLGERIRNRGEFIDEALRILRMTSPNEGNPSLIGGFLAGSQEDDPEFVDSILEQTAGDPSLCVYTVQLTHAITVRSEHLTRIAELVEQDRIPVESVRAFAYGRPLVHLPPKVVMAFTGRIFSAPDKGCWAALEILFMYQYQDSAKWTGCVPEFRRYLLSRSLIDNIEIRGRDVGHWSEIATRLLEQQNADTVLATHLAKEIVRVCKNEELAMDHDYAFEAVASVLLKDFRDMVWPIFSDALLGKDLLVTWNLTHLLTNHQETDDRPGLLSTMEDEFLKNWCVAHPDSAPAFLARNLPLLQEVDGQWTWRPLAKWLIDQYGPAGKILDELKANLGTYTWGGSLVPYFERQIKPFEELQKHPNSAVRRWAGQHLEYLNAEIRVAQQELAERAGGIHE